MAHAKRDFHMENFSQRDQTELHDLTQLPNVVLEILRTGCNAPDLLKVLLQH